MNTAVEWFGYALMLLLLWRLTAWRAWRTYPFFCTFYAAVILRTGGIKYFERALAGDGLAYSRWFWYSSLALDAFRFTVAWEAFRKILAPGTVAHRTTGLLLVMTMVSLSVFFVFHGAQETNVILDGELGLSLVAAVWAFMTLGVARYYRITPNLNAWGITLGTGIITSFHVVNFASLGISPDIFRVFGYARALTFEATVVLWLWTLWSFSPAPFPPSDSGGSSGPSSRAPTAGDALRKALDL